MDYSYTEYMNYNRLDKQWAWNQYRLTPEPPRRDLQEFIKAYKETGDERQLLFYLHYAEPLINLKARKLCCRYHVENYFAEIKTVIIETLIEILPDSDGSVGTTFWQYAYLYIKGNVNVFMCDGCWNELPDKDKRTYNEIAHDFELRSPQAVGDNRRKVTEELRKILKKHEG